MNAAYRSMLGMLACVLLTVVGICALLANSIKVNNHLSVSAGDLEVGLYRISYTEYVFDEEDGNFQNTNRVDLTVDNSALFSITNAVPSGWYQTTLEVSNLGATAFDYGMRILWEANDDPTDNDEVFASQIRITVTSEHLNEPVVFMLDECSENDIPLGYLSVNAPAQTFTVKAEFVNSDENSSAMLATLAFDVQVYAIPKTG